APCRTGGESARGALRGGAARRRRDLTGGAGRLKGGHLPGDDLVDLLLDGDGVTEFSGTRLAGRHTHGTGCTLASAIATRLAQGVALVDAVEQARAYVRAAIAQAPGLGQGAGPLWHAHGWGDGSER
ncbi:bifunctional hydroxymethylpyrimidine kinase/phosphomethylpyrimidine kinase, partial [Acetobacter sp.]|uniref:bifunctional hydroxymethylpyrimidine kinase/phosphomethylpyrimidine kinase n=1 Tax=Acetobacter sp. TaxID=440 RepID=UPI0039EC55C6